MTHQVVFATILNPLTDKHCQYIERGVLIINSGKIKLIGEEGKTEIPADADILDRRGKLIMPGFYDMHFHWVQDDVRLMPKASLLTWLQKYTFPVETRFANASYAKKKSQAFFKRLNKVGTVGGGCYSSVHSAALDSAMKEAKGQFVIGNVTMTICSPSKLTQTKSTAINLIKNSLKKYKKRYAFTPRFALATDYETMQAGANLTKKAGAFIQTHLSENYGEIAAVLDLYRGIKGFETVKNYTEIYHKCNILGPKTIMGHGIHLSKDELALLAKTKTTIAHCPTSNAPIRQRGLGSGLFDFREVEKAKIRWALASDIGGGPFLSMFDVMRSFVDQNRKQKINQATFIKALYRSTLAGAEILGIDKEHGNLSKGKFADFIVLTMPKINGKKSAEKILEKLCNRHKGNRKLYDKMPIEVYLKGIKL